MTNANSPQQSMMITDIYQGDLEQGISYLMDFIFQGKQLLCLLLGAGMQPELLFTRHMAMDAFIV